MLKPVLAPQGWGVFASDGPNFRHAVFGRDSIEVAEDLCSYDQALAHDIILTLARLQGTRHNADSEEEPGKIHHEYRSAQFAGQAIPAESLAIMRKLQAKKWGDANMDTMLYYGAYDSTPLYIRLVQQYAATYGDDILGETYHNKDGHKRTILGSVQAATDWLVDKLNLRDDHLLAYRRSNPQGIRNQVWKDSSSAYLFSDGTMPDHDKGVVSTELQGYAYDALLYATQIFPARAGELTALAEAVQRSTTAKLWMPEQRYFAQGLGIHSSGEERVIDTLTSNGALLLDSQLLDNLPECDTYIDAIEQMVLGDEFLTPAGIRCRAKRYAGLLPFTDYHGSYAVWAKETADIARGLERHGRTTSAAKLRHAILSSFRTAGERYELFYVDLDNTVYYGPAEAVAHLSSTTKGEPMPIPEPDQAWSISAAITSAQILSEPIAKTPFQQSFGKAQLHRASVTRLFSSAQSVLRRRNSGG